MVGGEGYFSAGQDPVPYKYFHQLINKSSYTTISYQTILNCGNQPCWQSVVGTLFHSVLCTG